MKILLRPICWLLGHQWETDGHRPFPDNTALHSCMRCGAKDY